MMNTQGNITTGKCLCCNQNKCGREALRALISASQSVSASLIGGGSRENLLLEVILELVLKLKEIWMTEIAP